MNKSAALSRKALNISQTKLAWTMPALRAMLGRTPASKAISEAVDAASGRVGAETFENLLNRKAQFAIEQGNRKGKLYGLLNGSLVGSTLGMGIAPAVTEGIPVSAYLKSLVSRDGENIIGTANRLSEAGKGMISGVQSPKDVLNIPRALADDISEAVKEHPIIAATGGIMGALGGGYLGKAVGAPIGRVHGMWQASPIRVAISDYGNRFSKKL